MSVVVVGLVIWIRLSINIFTFLFAEHILLWVLSSHLLLWLFSMLQKLLIMKIIYYKYIFLNHLKRIIIPIFSFFKKLNILSYSIEVFTFYSLEVYTVHFVHQQTTLGKKYDSLYCVFHYLTYLLLWCFDGPKDKCLL